MEKEVLFAGELFAPLWPDADDIDLVAPEDTRPEPVSEFASVPGLAVENWCRA